MKNLLAIVVLAVVASLGTADAQPQNPYSPCTDPPLAIPGVSQLYNGDWWLATVEPISTTCYNQGTGFQHEGTTCQQFSGNCTTNPSADNAFHLSCSEETTALIWCNSGNGGEFNLTYVSADNWTLYTYCSTCENQNESVGCGTTWNVWNWRDNGHSCN
jgi:hypothetical protein